MGYSIEAIITSTHVLDSSQFKNTNLRFARLSKNIWLLPIEENNTSEIERIIRKSNLQQDDLDKYSFGNYSPDSLSSSIAIFCSELSQSGPVMYCEAEFFAGMGGQYGVIWESREIIYGPVFMRYNQPNEEYNVNTLEEMAINRCLSRIMKSKLVSDRFGDLGLGRFRRTAKWYSAINEGLTI